MIDDDDIYRQLGLAARWYTGVESGLRDILARLLGGSHTARAVVDEIQPGQLATLIEKAFQEAALGPVLEGRVKVALRAARAAAKERNRFVHAAWGATTTASGLPAAHSLPAKRYNRDLDPGPMPFDELVRRVEAIYSAGTVVGRIYGWLPTDPIRGLPLARVAMIDQQRIQDYTNPGPLWDAANETMGKVWPEFKPSAVQEGPGKRRRKAEAKLAEQTITDPAKGQAALPHASTTDR